LEEISGVDGQHRDPIGVLEALISKKYIEIVSLRTGQAKRTYEIWLHTILFTRSAHFMASWPDKTDAMRFYLLPKNNNTTLAH
jgi:hypothetical protein